MNKVFRNLLIGFLVVVSLTIFAVLFRSAFSSDVCPVVDYPDVYCPDCPIVDCPVCAAAVCPVVVCPACLDCSINVSRDVDFEKINNLVWRGDVYSKMAVLDTKKFNSAFMGHNWSRCAVFSDGAFENVLSALGFYQSGRDGYSDFGSVVASDYSVRLDYLILAYEDFLEYLQVYNSFCSDRVGWFNVSNDLLIDGEIWLARSEAHLRYFEELGGVLIE